MDRFEIFTLSHEIQGGFLRDSEKACLMQSISFRIITVDQGDRV